LSILAKEKRIAVLIDAENISANYAEPLFEEIAKRGEISFCRAFGDFDDERMRAWETQAKDFGVSVFQQDPVSGFKNSSDIALVIGAMDLLHWKRAERFYIVSKDGDFTPLANRIKSAGLDVIGVGTKGASQAFKNACNDFVTLSLDAGTHDAGTHKVLDVVNPSKAPTTNERPIEEAEEAILTVLKDSAEKDGWVSMAVLGKALKERQPKFIYKEFGFATLSKLLNQSSRFNAEPKHSTPRVRASNHSKNTLTSR